MRLLAHRACKDKMAYVLVLVAASLLIRASMAQCDDGCDSLQVIAFTECGVDPNDGSMLGIFAQACPCDVGEVFDNTITFYGTDGGGV